MILLSAHRDIVRSDIPFEFKNGIFSGLLDNEIGRYVMYSVLNNPSISELEKQGEIKFWENQHEEFGLLVNFPKLDPDQDIVINIDVCSNDRYKNKDVGIEQFYGHVDSVSNAIGELCWEGYNLYTMKYTGDPNEADECDQWHDLDIPHLSFIIPIECDNDNWHGKASISLEKVKKAILILTRLICYLS